MKKIFTSLSIIGTMAFVLLGTPSAADAA